MRESWVSGGEEFERFFREDYAERKDRAPGRVRVARDSGEDKNREGRMMRALAAYPLLYDVPAEYLIPLDSLLEENEIRFFYLDFNWIRALLDGMFSVGRASGIDRAHDERFIYAVYAAALDKSADVRSELQGKESERQGLGEYEVCTGFLLRSRLVRGWRGLEFKAFGVDGKPLTALRIETLSDDVLLGIFKGKIGRLDIAEPPEGLYHGLKGPDGDRTVALRRLSDGSGVELAPIKARVDENRVVDIDGLAGDIGKALGLPGGKADGAHMALQMLRTARRLEIKEGSGTRL